MPAPQKADEQAAPTAAALVADATAVVEGSISEAFVSVATGGRPAASPQQHIPAASQQANRTRFAFDVEAGCAHVVSSCHLP